MSKICPICEIEKKDEDFGFRGPSRPNELFSYCNLCRNNRRKQEWLSLKLEMFEAYGGVRCACCGESRHHSFLALDHINNNGAVERKSLGRHGTGVMFYARLKKLGWPSGYQVLCHNCNVAKSIVGECPHKFLFGNGVTGNILGSESSDSRSES